MNSSNSRPGSELKLESWIDNKFKNRKTPPKAKNLIAKLKEAKHLNIKDGTIEYTLSSQNSASCLRSFRDSETLSPSIPTLGEIHDPPESLKVIGKILKHGLKY
jgi:hypothetical protein